MSLLQVGSGLMLLPVTQDAEVPFLGFLRIHHQTPPSPGGIWVLLSRSSKDGLPPSRALSPGFSDAISLRCCCMLRPRDRHGRRSNLCRYRTALDKLKSRLETSLSRWPQLRLFAGFCWKMPEQVVEAEACNPCGQDMCGWLVRAFAQEQSLVHNNGMDLHK